MKELDDLLGEFFEKYPPPPSEIPLWEALLAHDNEKLFRWLIEGIPCSCESLKSLIEKIRRWAGR